MRPRKNAGLKFENLNILNPLCPVFLHREALYKDDKSSGGALEEEHREEFGGILNLEFPDEARFGLEFQDIVPSYLHAFEDVFSKASFDSLPKCKQWDHAIELLPNSAPSTCEVYLLAPKEQDKLDTFLQENLDSSHICPSKSPMASLVFFIEKKDGLLQLVQDYWVLNAMTMKDCYPLPLISELINNLWGACYFTKLDVWWGYNNMCIQEGNKWKVAFQTNWGLFEPLIMFLGLTNSPATFQTMMNNIF
ncbi:hypothetical protein E4T56_gene18595 [Termitomyces sp. T112]|nr:hypothetical protein E4T56_gene18595 [Termitomyces sp. T112]